MTEANGDGNMVSVFHGAWERFIETKSIGPSCPWPRQVSASGSGNRSKARRRRPWLSLVVSKPSRNDDRTPTGINHETKASRNDADAEVTNETRPGETIVLDENEDLILYLPEDYHHAREQTQAARKNARTPEEALTVIEPPRFLGSEMGYRPVFEQGDFFYWKVIDRFGKVVWRWGPPPHTSLWLR